jgi:hypothetical protein
MPWCLRNRFGELFAWTVHDTQGQLIDYALEKYDPGHVLATTRLARWGRIKREFGLTAVKVEIVETVHEPGRLTDAQRLALCVLRGDTQAALALADLVLETYHAAKQDG